MWYYHVTLFRHKESIGDHGLLSGKRLRELNLGQQTTGWKSGESFIHVTDNISKAVRWFREVFLFANVVVASEWWIILRFDSSSVTSGPRKDPKSQTGLIFELDRIPPEVLTYRFGENYEEGQPDELNGISIWKPLPRP